MQATKGQNESTLYLLSKFSPELFEGLQETLTLNTYGPTRNGQIDFALESFRQSYMNYLNDVVTFNTEQVRRNEARLRFADFRTQGVYSRYDLGQWAAQAHLLNNDHFLEHWRWERYSLISCYPVYTRFWAGLDHENPTAVHEFWF